MSRFTLKVLVFLSLLLALCFFFIVKSNKNDQYPPLSGWMEKFVAVDVRSKPAEFSLQGRNGSNKVFSEWRGKITLVNFWATWCSPCVRELPSLMRLSQKLDNKNFAVVALSQDSSGWRKIIPFIQKNNLHSLPVYLALNGSFLSSFNVRALPTSILFDREGHEIGRLTGHAEWDSAEALELIQHYSKE